MNEKHELKSLAVKAVEAHERNASIRISATEYGFIARAVCSCGWEIGAHRTTPEDARERAERMWEVHVLEQPVIVTEPVGGSA